MGFLLSALGLIDSLFSWKCISLYIPGMAILRLQEAVCYSTPRGSQTSLIFYINIFTCYSILTGMSTEKIYRLDVAVLKVYKNATYEILFTGFLIVKMVRKTLLK